MQNRTKLLMAAASGAVLALSVASLYKPSGWDEPLAEHDVDSMAAPSLPGDFKPASGTGSNAAALGERSTSSSSTPSDTESSVVIATGNDIRESQFSIRTEPVNDKGVLPSAEQSSPGASAATGVLDTGGSDQKLSKLLDSIGIRCSFGAGNNTGTRFGAELSNGSASWQGGPITFDSFNAAEGSARMTGSVGATGSQSGELKVNLIAEETKLHFVGILSNGNLVSTTVFTNLDEQHRHIAVMSRHEGRFNYGDQFLGTCE